MEIRCMTIDDYDAVYSLWLNTPGMGLNTTDDSRSGIAKYLDRNPTTSFVAVCDGRIVGVIMAGHDGRRGFIHHTAVLKAYQRQGVASALLDAATKALSALGIAKVALVAFARNEAGNAFWEQKGFFAREDLVYRNMALAPMERIDT